MFVIDFYLIKKILYSAYYGLDGWPDGKEPACNAGDPGSITGWEDPWGRACQATLVLLPGESYGQRSLEGCSPLGRSVRYD